MEAGMALIKTVLSLLCVVLAFTVACFFYAVRDRVRHSHDGHRRVR